MVEYPFGNADSLCIDLDELGFITKDYGTVDSLSEAFNALAMMFDSGKTVYSYTCCNWEGDKDLG